MVREHVTDKVTTGQRSEETGLENVCQAVKGNKREGPEVEAARRPGGGQGPEGGVAEESRENGGAGGYVLAAPGGWHLLDCRAVTQAKAFTGLGPRQDGGSKRRDELGGCCH